MCHAFCEEQKFSTLIMTACVVHSEQNSTVFNADYELSDVHLILFTGVKPRATFDVSWLFKRALRLIMKCCYDEIRICPLYAVFKTLTSCLWEKENKFYYFQISLSVTISYVKWFEYYWMLPQRKLTCLLRKTKIVLESIYTIYTWLEKRRMKSINHKRYDFMELSEDWRSVCTIMNIQDCFLVAFKWHSHRSQSFRKTWKLFMSS